MKTCKVENCNTKYHAKKYCRKHYVQIRKYGKIRPFDPNKIIDKGTHYEMVLYDRKSNEKARTIFDKQWLLEVKKYRWGMSGGYCVTKGLFLHHLIIGKPPQGLLTDHKNRDRLDNRDENLRFVTPQVNCINRNVLKNTYSGIKGVTYHKKRKIWRAQIKINGKMIQLGCSVNKQRVIHLRKKAEQIVDTLLLIN